MYRVWIEEVKRSDKKEISLASAAYTNKERCSSISSTISSSFYPRCIMRLEDYDTAFEAQVKTQSMHFFF